MGEKRDEGEGEKKKNNTFSLSLRSSRKIPGVWDRNEKKTKHRDGPARLGLALSRLVFNYPQEDLRVVFSTSVFRPASIAWSTPYPPNSYFQGHRLRYLRARISKRTGRGMSVSLFFQPACTRTVSSPGILVQLPRLNQGEILEKQHTFSLRPASRYNSPVRTRYHILSSSHPPQRKDAVSLHIRSQQSGISNGTLK